ncbi:hypothetical protein [Acinetobacter lwoffii]|uniref:hypothetical protein n=2 Tax=Acinetobacter TaxID=469 RepID=UPI00259EC928|nr:hypothetical protein [Acinetobacter baumannii]
MCNKEILNPFSLKSPCKDCPFKKDKNYLRADRIQEIMDYMIKDDEIFSCHKTVDYEAIGEFNEALEELEYRVDEIDSFDKEKARDEVYERYKDRYTAGNEKVCAGWLILGKKENIIFNNFRLRVAAMEGLLNIDEFKNEEDVFESVEEAIKGHIG